MNKNTTLTYSFYTLVTLWTLTLLYLFVSYLRDNITYAHESQQHQHAILQTTQQIQDNSTRRIEIDKTIQQLKQEQQSLQSTNTELRSSLEKQKQTYQEFLGFSSGTKE